MLLPEAVHVKEEMQPADHCICPFSHFPRFVGQKIYLARDCLAVDPKDGTLPRSEEVDGPGCSGSDGKCTCKIR